MISRAKRRWVAWLMSSVNMLTRFSHAGYETAVNTQSPYGLIPVLSQDFPPQDHFGGCLRQIYLNERQSYFRKRHFIDNYICKRLLNLEMLKPGNLQQSLIRRLIFLIKPSALFTVKNRNDRRHAVSDLLRGLWPQIKSAPLRVVA